MSGSSFCPARNFCVVIAGSASVPTSLYGSLNSSYRLLPGSSTAALSPMAPLCLGPWTCLHSLGAGLQDFGHLTIGHAQEGVGVVLSPSILDIKVEYGQVGHPTLVCSVEFGGGHHVLQGIVISKNRELASIKMIMELVVESPLESEELELVCSIPCLGWAQASARIRDNSFHSALDLAPLLKLRSAAGTARCSLGNPALEHQLVFLSLPHIQPST